MSDFCNPMDYSLPGSSVHGISKARILECVAISFSKGSSWPGDGTRVSCPAGRVLTNWATGEANPTYTVLQTTQMAPQVNNLPAMQETEEMRVRPLGGRDPLEREMATHSSISCLKNPMDRAWWATVHGITQSQMWLSIIFIIICIIIT